MEIKRSPSAQDRRVYMSFFVRGHAALPGGQWIVSFLEPDCVTPIGRIRRFASEDKVREIIARTRTPLDLATRHALDLAFAKGRGGIFLTLTGEQYRKLRA
jgi:hypothetical protein